MCENSRNSMFPGDPAWHISSKESLGKLQVYERIVIVCICSKCYQIPSQYNIINNRCLKIGVHKINI